ncbi:MAG: YgiT-type zinc finger protein [Planctomycetota bacterium]|nr:YgiT-type zinc finger protein [Planctomycetota bacterium]
MLKHKTCPTCGSKRIKLVRRTLTRSSHGQIYKVPNVQFHACPDCGEHVYSPEAVSKIQAHSPAFAKRRRSALPA